MGVTEKDGSVKKHVQGSAKDGIIHCDCGTGCVECYGKVNCGCPECYVPIKKPRKKRKLKIKTAEEDELIFNDVLPTSIIHVQYENCLLSHHQVANQRAQVVQVYVQTNDDVDVIRRNTNIPFRRRPVSCIEKSSVRTKHRISLPDMDFNVKTGNPKPRTRLRDSFVEKEVGPPKQTKYFCKKCQKDICTECFKSVCNSHNVQFIGSTRFFCESPFHKIDHSL